MLDCLNEKSIFWWQIALLQHMGNGKLTKKNPIVQTSRIFKVFIFALILINIGSMDLNFETVFLCVA